MRRTRLLGLLVAAVALLPTTSVAGGLTDGRTGPVEIDGHVLDHMMADLNDFLQARYANEDMMHNLDAAPSADFVTVATAVSATPLDRAQPESSEFGWSISGGNSLDLHLAAFQDEVMGRGQDLFIRVAMAEVGKGMDFATVASDVYQGFDGMGPIHNDPSLNAEMRNLLEGMREFDDRAARISQAVPSVSGTSFDRYIDALRMF